MNKQFLLAVITLGLVQISYAETGMENHPDPTVNESKSNTASRYSSGNAISMITPQIGYVAGNLENEDGKSGSAKAGLSIGASADLGREKLVFEPGLLYRQEGAQSSDGTLKLNLNYLVIPVIGKFYFKGAENNSPYFKFGAMPSFLLSKEVTYSYGGFSDSNTDVSGLNTFVLDAAIGIGGKFKVDADKDLMFELVYNRSITSASSNEKIYNSVFGFNIGMGFNL